MTPYSVGQRVVTDFNGRLTTHTVVGVKTGRSQTGVMYLLDPPPHKEHPAWLDHAWLSPI